MARVNNPGRTFAAYGDRASPNVRELQQVLHQLGIYSGEITGAFDDATYQAYRQACRAAHLPISRDKKGRLVVTLGDFEALEQLDAGAVDFAAAETQVEAEDDFAKRPVDASELEEDSAKYPVASNGGRPVRRRWVVLLAVLGVVVAAAVILATRPTRDADDPQQAAPTATTATAVPTAIATPTATAVPTTSAALAATAAPTATAVPTTSAALAATAVPTATAMPTSNPQDFEISITGNKTCSITRYTGNDTQLEIPSTIQGYTVTAIGDYAFFLCDSLTSITIPDSVTAIGDYAFYCCFSLTSITIPDSVTAIGAFAFSYCDSLTSITIPDSVTAIGAFAFSYCDSLTSITIPDSVTAIGDFAFEDCDSLTSITIPDSVTYIGRAAFEYCDSLTSIYVTENSYAHQYCVDNDLPYQFQ